VITGVFAVFAVQSEARPDTVRTRNNPASRLSPTIDAMPFRRGRLVPLLCLGVALLVLVAGLRRFGPDSPRHLLLAPDPAVPRQPDAEMERKAPRYVRSILDAGDTSFDRLACPTPDARRYGPLRGGGATDPAAAPAVRFFFVVTVRQASHVLPRLLGSVVEAIRFLGPEACVLSVAEEGSRDGTWEILRALSPALRAAGIANHLHASASAPRPEDARTPRGMGALRNAALGPLAAERVDARATVVFLDGVAACAEDILELVHARQALDATMTCGLDWAVEPGRNPTFASAAAARTVGGDVFLDGRAGALLLGSDAEAFERLEAHRPFSVFSCWGGGAAVSAGVLLGANGVRFRAPDRRQEACFSESGGEEILFAAALWRAGEGRVAVLPSVNLAYSDDAAEKVKSGKGYVGQWVKGRAGRLGPESVAWREAPPGEVQCRPEEGREGETRWPLDQL